MLHAFLTAPKPGKARLKPCECYCVKCRLPKRPALDMAEYAPISDRSGNLRGLCPECETLMYRRVSLAKLPEVSAGIDVTLLKAERHLEGRASRCPNVDSEGV